jgi:hypothetical protein
MKARAAELPARAAGAKVAQVAGFGCVTDQQITKSLNQPIKRACTCLPAGRAQEPEQKHTSDVSIQESEP